MSVYRTTNLPRHTRPPTPLFDVDWRGWLAVACIAPRYLAAIVRAGRSKP